MRSMKVLTKAPRILWAVLACASLTVHARAAASPEGGSSSATEVNAGRPAGRAFPTQNSSSKPGRSGDAEPKYATARTRAGSNGRDAASAASPGFSSPKPKPGPGRAVDGNAIRLHALLNAQARGHLAHQPAGRPIGSTRARTGALGARVPYGTGEAGQPTLADSKRTALPAAKLTAIPRNSAIGGPHVQSSGRLGGPVASRTNHGAAIDGTQLRRKF
jgi:hypothetical protein